MLKTEHAETAQQFLNAAYREFAHGDMLQASEKMWGAAVHAIEAVAQERGWEYGSHRKLVEAARCLADEQDDAQMNATFGVAQSFHANFYHGFMLESDFGPNAKSVEELVERVLAVLEEG